MKSPALYLSAALFLGWGVRSAIAAPLAIEPTPLFFGS
jgi:hypothetical protein